MYDSDLPPIPDCLYVSTRVLGIHIGTLRLGRKGYSMSADNAVSIARLTLIQGQFILSVTPAVSH